MVIQRVKLEDLEKTKSFYKRTIKEERLTEKQKNSFLLALGAINKLIEKENTLKEKKHFEI